MSGFDPGIADPDRLVARIGEIGVERRLLVALDFDGTLAPFVLDPETARIVPAAIDAILGLAGSPATRVAVISGRSLASLDRVLPEFPSSVLLVGSHGVEYRLDHPEDSGGVGAGERERVEILAETLESALRSRPDVWIERKPVGVSIHTRGAPTEDARDAIGIGRDVAQAIGFPLVERVGKDILEFAVRDATKGDAITRLRDYTNASAVFYAGDDVTDEDAFAALRPGDLGVKCGAGPTMAEFRVADIDAMIEVLRLLAAHRLG